MTEPVLEFREEIVASGFVPRWLRAFVGLRILYAIGLHLDILREMLLKGVTARFPGVHRDATPLLCRDLKALRGPEETEAQIAERLRTRRITAPTKGNAISVLLDLQAYLTPYNPRIRAVNNNGAYSEIASDGTLSFGMIEWNWDGNTSLFSRFWVLIWVPPALWQNDGTFGDSGLVGDGGVLGSTALPEVVAGVRHIVKEQASLNARHMHTILIFDDTAWQAQQPNGHWDLFGSRNPSASYWAGDRS
jgi:hypothetical protein